MIDASLLVVGLDTDADHVARWGQECGVPTPLRERVTEIIHPAEHGEIRPSPNALRDLGLAG
jgi:hypothetical protein